MLKKAMGGLIHRSKNDEKSSIIHETLLILPIVPEGV
jgi:hypothetical protein